LPVCASHRLAWTLNQKRPERPTQVRPSPSAAQNVSGDTQLSAECQGKVVCPPVACPKFVPLHPQPRMFPGTLNFRLNAKAKLCVPRLHVHGGMSPGCTRLQLPQGRPFPHVAVGWVGVGPPASRQGLATHSVSPPPGSRKTPAPSAAPDRLTGRGRRWFWRLSNLKTFAPTGLNRSGAALGRAFF
jgi:hypothetical protein